MTAPFIPNVRALKGTAPNAGQINRLDNNHQWLNLRTKPRYSLIQTSANLTITFPASGAGVTVTFNSIYADSNGMVSGSTITMPSSVTAVRFTYNLGFTTVANREFIAFGANQTATFEIGYSASSAGMQTCNLPGEWFPTTTGTVYNTTIALLGTASTSLSGQLATGNTTWLCVEVR